MQVSKQWLFAGVLVLAGAVLAGAQQPPPQNSSAENQTKAQAAATPAHAQAAASHVLRADEIDGLDVMDHQGRKIGEIEDMVVNLQTGKVEYAAIEHDRKLIVVPWQCLAFRFGRPNDADARYFVLSASEEQWNTAQGFHRDRWPSLSAQWATSVNRHFGVSVEHPASGQTQPAVAYETMFRVDELEDMKIDDPQRQRLGKVEDVAIDVNRGTVAYLALEYGHWYSGGHKLFAVPLSAFTVAHADNHMYLTLAMNQDALRSAPGFAKNHWPSHADQRFLTEMNSYYERHAQAGGNTPGKRQ